MTPDELAAAPLAQSDQSDESEKLSDEELSEIEEAEPEAEPVSYTGTDFDVEGLVRRLARGDIVVPNFGHDDSTLELAGFQRAFVWRRSQMDRFIESLLLGFPIPGIMVAIHLGISVCRRDHGKVLRDN